MRGFRVHAKYSVMQSTLHCRVNEQKIGSNVPMTRHRLEYRAGDGAAAEFMIFGSSVVTLHCKAGGTGDAPPGPSCRSRPQAGSAVAPTCGKILRCRCRPWQHSI